VALVGSRLPIASVPRESHITSKKLLPSAVNQTRPV